MARHNILLLTILIILFTSLGSALTVSVDIEEITEFDLVNTNYTNETNNAFEFNGTLENTGSIGCTYQLRGEFEQGNDTFERYSGKYPVWQGAFEFVELHHVPENYTGQVDAEIKVDYCGQTEKVEELSFQVGENVTSEGVVGSETLEVDNRTSRVELEGVENGTLVPETMPTRWQVASVPIEDSQATLEYDAPIFTEGSSLNYTILGPRNDVLGTVTVDLEVEPTLADRFREYLVEIVLVILALSVFANILLAYRDLSGGNPEEEAVDE